MLSVIPGPYRRRLFVAKRNRRRQNDMSLEAIISNQDMMVQMPKSVSIKYKNRTQRDYAHLIEQKDIVFAIGSAGTGKTYLAAVEAVKRFTNGEIKRIVVCRPAVPAGGEDIGFLPGAINDKMYPYLRPIFDAFELYWPQSRIRTFLEYGQLEIVPLAFMRGRTFTDTFIIADEMQNATVDQMLMLLTRLGEGSRMVITGDPTQSDARGRAAFEYARGRLAHIPSIGFVDFSTKDVVRHSTVQRILESWSDETAEEVEELEVDALPAFIQREPLMNGHALGGDD